MCREAPPGRWILSPDKLLHTTAGEPDTVFTARGCFVDECIPDWTSPSQPARVVEALDPMFHMLIRAGQAAFENARTGDLDRDRVGVIVGNIALPTAGASRIANEVLAPLFGRKFLGRCQGETCPISNPLDRYVTGLPAGILGSSLGLRGGTFTLDAACASSLYAVKLACDELLSHRADAMLAGGLSRPDSLYTQMGFTQLRALSLSGRCSPFDHKGDGLLVGEGSGVVVLKRLSTALAHGDDIAAVIRGVGLSNDVEGNLLSPNSEGQLRALRAAYLQAEWTPDMVDLIECHATGTPVGDAVEFESLRRLWENRRGRCVLSAVKSNIGHLLTAAGSAGLIKTLLALRHQTLPPIANFERPSESIKLAGSPFAINATSEPWVRRAPDVPRRAAVSGFGFGGINAHLLVEEWMPERAAARPSRPKPASAANTTAPEPIAIVGMGVHVGSWTSLPKFRDRVLGNANASDATPSPRKSWRGLTAEEISEVWEAGAPFFPGFYAEDLTVPLDRFHIPPREMAEMLPQQLLMLEVAKSAFEDAGIHKVDSFRTGVFIGINLDLRTTDYHFRWATMSGQTDRARPTNGDSIQSADPAWSQEVCDSSGPPLTADKTLGSLGGIVASRVAREFRIGGPSHTISSEDTSGLRAVEVAVRALQNGELDTALAGAVDLAGDVRTLLATDAVTPYSRGGNARPFDRAADGTVPGEGAAGVVLKRLSDARRDGDRVYAVIRGVGAASGRGAAVSCPSAEIIRLALARACDEARVSPESIDYLETHGSGNPSEDDSEAAALVAFFGGEKRRSTLKIGSAKPDVGHAGAASGLVSLVKACLCLSQRRIAALRGCSEPLPSISQHEAISVPRTPRHWVRDRILGPRRAGVSSLGLDGNCLHVVLEEADTSFAARSFSDSRECTMIGDEGLFLVAGEDAKTFSRQITALLESSSSNRNATAADAARAWWHSPHRREKGSCRAALFARDIRDLPRLARSASETVANDRRGGIEPEDRDRLLVSGPREPLEAGKLAFVFPGSGNECADMGRELTLAWPEILEAQDAENERLASQLFAEGFWTPALPDSIARDHRALICGQVSFGAMMSDLAIRFGLRPCAAIGYSLGESTALFAFRAWQQRDDMFDRLSKSSLFTEDLTGSPQVLRTAWGLSEPNPAEWVAGLVNKPVDEVRAVIGSRSQVYVLIINTPEDCVLGGNRSVVESVVQELGCHWFPLHGVSTVHCELARRFRTPYRELHRFETAQPAGIDFYSGAWGRCYPVDTESTADAIEAQALDTIDFPRVIRAAYEDGVRRFIEMGPGNSCARMISKILGQRPHFSRSLSTPVSGPVNHFLRTLASAFVEGESLDLTLLYGKRPSAESKASISQEKPRRTVTVPISGPPFVAPTRNPPPGKLSESKNQPTAQTSDFTESIQTQSRAQAGESIHSDAEFRQVLLQQFSRAEAATSEAHASFLTFSNKVSESLAEIFAHCIEQPGTAFEDRARSSESERVFPPAAEPGPPAGWDSTGKPRIVEPPQEVGSAGGPGGGTFEIPTALNRAACLEFGRGRAADVLGPVFAEADSFPTRVRLPDEPLMLVDRILEIQGEPLSMTQGRVITEHDIHASAWYLDCGRIPTCIAVEAGQADLFLSGYLGIDFQTRGRSMYRLLDAKVCFHRPLPGPGEVIRYDIRIERFFRQSDTWLFKFSFEATVDGAPLLSMTDGCAGFFSAQELAGGRGIVRPSLDLKPMVGKRTPDWEPFVEVRSGQYSTEQLGALRRGDLGACFGGPFAQLTLQKPVTLPSGLMTLVHNISRLEPEGGRFGLGLIRGEAVIAPGDWFLKCHFVDDQVMPGTLMFECCLHTLRVFLLRLGWVHEEGEATLEPVPEIASQLKCRGQVTAATQSVTYEVAIKEIGYRPEPYVVADALMYADGKPIVEIINMSLRYLGASIETFRRHWAGRAAPPRKPALYDSSRILAFAIGKPSEAFGEAYRIFDHDRVIARLPGPPYQFLDRVTEIHAKPWRIEAGAEIESQYDVPAGAWYFKANRQNAMPFAVLLEIALQPCGWLAGYMGSALTSEEDLSFRNLGGTAIQLQKVTSDTGILSTRVKLTRASSSAGMIIQFFDFSVTSQSGLVYQGNTYFGFFPKIALLKQEGLKDPSRSLPSANEEARGTAFEFPHSAPFPTDRLRLLDRIECFVPDGGAKGLGYVRATRRIDPDEWFFKAHFYQDPVVPGSLGLESFLHLLKVLAQERWPLAADEEWEAVALGIQHEWIYRGQVIPSNRLVTVEAAVIAVDESQRLIRADGWLSVDGLLIYGMKDFAVRRSARV